MTCKITRCDICGEDITYSDIKYKFKMYENDYCNYEDFEFTKWTKLDMCESCYKKFCEFVSERRKNKK